MKRFVSLILITVLVLSLAACSKPDIGEAENDDTITQAGIDISGQEESISEPSTDADSNSATHLQPLSYPISPDIMKLDYIDLEMTTDRLEAEKLYVSKEVNELSPGAEVDMFYYMDGYKYHFMDGAYGDKRILMAVSIFSPDLIGPLGIRVGDSEEEVRAMYPDSMVSDSQMGTEGNYVVQFDDDIRIIPSGVMPFAIVRFEEGTVSEIRMVYFRF